MLANEMKELSKNSRNNNEKLNEYWEKTIEMIRETARQGLNEMSYVKVAWSHDYDNYSIMNKKLEDNGFRVVEGWEIGKPMRNSRSKYIIW